MPSRPVRSLARRPRRARRGARAARRGARARRRARRGRRAVRARLDGAHARRRPAAAPDGPEGRERARRAARAALALRRRLRRAERQRPRLADRPRASSRTTRAATTGPARWQDVQWNFAGPAGVNAPQAWANLIADGRPGGRGVTIAVLDTGVAYGNRPPYAISPDFSRAQFVRGFDFVDRDAYPFDRNGHGTHVAGTLAEATEQRRRPDRPRLRRPAACRCACSTRPARATRATSPPGIRYAARRGAKIINLSLEFDTDVHGRRHPADPRRDRLRARARVARRRRLGQRGPRARRLPGARERRPVGRRDDRARRAFGVLQRRQRPRHRRPRRRRRRAAHRRRELPARRRRRAATSSRSRCSAARSTRFGIPGSYEGTSMAVPHVAATAALVVASGVLGAEPVAGADRAPARDDRPRPRRQGLRHALRLGPGRRRRRDRARRRPGGGGGTPSAASR